MYIILFWGNICRPIRHYLIMCSQDPSTQVCNRLQGITKGKSRVRLKKLSLPIYSYEIKIITEEKKSSLFVKGQTEPLPFLALAKKNQKLVSVTQLKLR